MVQFHHSAEPRRQNAYGYTNANEFIPMERATREQRSAMLIVAVITKPLRIADAPPGGVSVESIIATGIDPNFTDVSGFSAVFHVMDRPDVSEHKLCYQMLHDAGANLAARRAKTRADPDAKNSRQETTLHWSVIRAGAVNNLTIFTALLDVMVRNYVTLNTVDGNNCTALCTAVVNQCSPELLSYFLQHKNLLELDAQDNHVERHGRTLQIGGETALHVAADQRMSHVASVLVDAGASVNTVNNVGWTPLYYSVRNADFATLVKIFGAPDCQERERLAAMDGLRRDESQPKSWSMWVNPEDLKDVSLTRLAHHVQSNLEEMVALLSDTSQHSGKVRQVSRTPFELVDKMIEAAETDDVVRLERLLRRHARHGKLDVNIREPDDDGKHTGDTPLILCVKNCSLRGVRALLRHGASVNKRSAPMKVNGVSLQLKPLDLARSRLMEIRAIMKTMLGHYELLTIEKAGELGKFEVTSDIVLGRNGQYKELWRRKREEWRQSNAPPVKLHIEDDEWKGVDFSEQHRAIKEFYETGEHVPYIMPMNIKDPGHECRKHTTDMNEPVLGVLATAHIEPRTVLGIYSGEIMNNAELEKTYTTLTQLEHCYGMVLKVTQLDEWSDNEKECNLQIDPKMMGNVFRCVNDYRVNVTFDEPQGTRPAKGFQNVLFQQATVFGQPCMVLMTTDVVEAGQELLVDYGADFWESHKMMRQVAYDIKPLYDSISRKQRIIQHMDKTTRALEAEVHRHMVNADKSRIKQSTMVKEVDKYLAEQKDLLAELLAMVSESALGVGQREKREIKLFLSNFAKKGQQLGQRMRQVVEVDQDEAMSDVDFARAMSQGSVGDGGEQAQQQKQKTRKILELYGPSGSTGEAWKQPTALQTPRVGAPPDTVVIEELQTPEPSGVGPPITRDMMLKHRLSRSNSVKSNSAAPDYSSSNSGTSQTSSSELLSDLSVSDEDNNENVGFALGKRSTSTRNGESVAAARGESSQTTLIRPHLQKKKGETKEKKKKRRVERDVGQTIGGGPVERKRAHERDYNNMDGGTMLRMSTDENRLDTPPTPQRGITVARSLAVVTAMTGANGVSNGAARKNRVSPGGVRRKSAAAIDASPRHQHSPNQKSGNVASPKFAEGF